LTIARAGNRSGLTRWFAPGRLIFLGIAAVAIFAAPQVLPNFYLSLLAKYVCFAIVAVGIDLTWGYGGMLALGQGVFFGLGGYSVGLFLKLQEAGPQKVPDFMSWSGVDVLPRFYEPLRFGWVALPAAVLVPALLGALLGALVFRQKVRGAYFAILTQALAAAFVILLIGQQAYTGGTNGVTNIHYVLGFDLNSPEVQRGLYVVTVVCLLGTFLLARALVKSRYGRLLIAVRDAEDRVRFLGYNPVHVKVVAFSISAAMAGLAGALFVPVVGIISPAMMGIVPSFEMLAAVAVGGRGTLVGAVAGALVLNYARSTLSDIYPGSWTLLQGALFIVVVLIAPTGLVGLFVWLLRQATRIPWGPLGARPQEAF
jgi:urea transport system permease protein